MDRVDQFAAKGAVAAGAAAGIANATAAYGGAIAAANAAGVFGGAASNVALATLGGGSLATGGGGIAAGITALIGAAAWPAAAVGVCIFAAYKTVRWFRS